MTISRRLFLAASTAAFCLPVQATQTMTKSVFTLGVASGSPRDNSIVLWTRLAPDPLHGGGMPAGLAQVHWRLCTDPAMRRLVAEGDVMTTDHKAHSVHVTVQGLQPGRDYFYQFSYGDEDSLIGRTRTTDPNATHARIALANCQNYETGYYHAYRDIAEWAPDCVVHVGDYLYENSARPPGSFNYGGQFANIPFNIVRPHTGGETRSLFEYRNRYAQYKMDRDLQAAHAAAPWIIAMDDHEVQNNWAAMTPQDPDRQTDLEFAVRRLAAFQAFYEHMPLEHPPILKGIGSELQMYGAYRFGPAQVSLLDTRQYRSDQACGDPFPFGPVCEEMQEPSRTMTGADQEEWILRTLKESTAAFNVIATQTWFAPYTYFSESGIPGVNPDQWDGYPVQRQRLLNALSETSNPVFLSGDWHCAMASTLHLDPTDTTSPRVGHNFAATSISSDCPWWELMDRFRGQNDHVAYLNGRQRGYLRCDITGKHFTGTFRTVDNVWDASSQVRTATEMRTSDF